MARKKKAVKKEVKSQPVKIEVSEHAKPSPLMVIRTSVQIKREDYMKILELRTIAQNEISPLEMRRAWGFFHGYIDDLAVNSYHLPKRTGLYGVTKDGYFTYTGDSMEVSKIERPDPQAYMNTPLEMG